MIEQAPKQNRKALSYLVLCAVVGAVMVYGAVSSNNAVVASVNGEKINKSELQELLMEQSGQEALDVLISLKIIDQEAVKQNIEVSEDDINKEMEKNYEYYGGQESFNQALAESGYTLEDVKADIAYNTKVKKLIEPRISITDEAALSYFEANKDYFAQEKQVRARHILVESEEKAKEVEERLSGGGDFTQLALEYSTDTATKENGGDLGFFGIGDMTEEFEQAAFSLAAGGVSGPVKTDYGYHIIKVEEIKEAQEANFENSIDVIKDILFEQQVQTEYNTWLDELYQQYEVENFLAKA